jgi:glucose-6-phosphate isomerase
MSHISFNYSKALKFVDENEILSLQETIDKNYETVYNRTGKGNDFLGWVNLPSEFDTNLIKDINQTADFLRNKAEVCIVVGIGGSYLGARAVIEALSPQFNLLKKKSGNPIVLFAGFNISEDYLHELLNVLDEKDYTMIVISKSGTTTEPAIAFRLLRRHMEQKYGIEEAKNRIVAITDKDKGALKQLANKEGYKTFIVPDDIGGRYSVLTPVGLLPIAVAGINIEKLLDGAKQMAEIVSNDYSIKNNPVSAYAAVRNILYKKGKYIEIMVNYMPRLTYFTEWWKQLYGESEGKDGKGIFPAGVNFTADLHSMGQYLQEGMRIMFETVISIERPKTKLKVPKDEANLDNLNYLAGKRIHEVNNKAEIATTLAHVEGGVPNLIINVPTMNEKYMGELIYFFEMACAISGYTLGVNPFDQPGVEAYKRNMFALLGKPGFEKEAEELQKHLER